MSKNDDMLMDGEEDVNGTETTRALAMMSGVAPAEEMPGLDLDSGSSRRSNKVLNQGTMLLVILFVVAGGALYIMRIGQSDLRSGGVAKDLELKVEQALARVLDTSSMAADDPLRGDQMQDLFKDTDSVLSMFTADPQSRQVPPEMVKKNPFVLPMFKSIAQPVQAAQDKDEHELELAREAGKYQLQSVMQGATPIAIINGDLYKVGQSLGNFTIQSIGELTVTLETEGRTYKLTMESQDTGKYKSPFGK